MTRLTQTTTVTPAQAGLQSVEVLRLATHSLTRHAELVSASILRPAPAEYVVQWTLKQVQGDEEAISPEGSVG